MNNFQVEENPDAYVPVIEKQHRRRQEMRRLEKLYEEEFLKKAYDADKALFDFDESVDNLSQVSDQYLADQNFAGGKAPPQAEDIHSNEEQGRGKEAAAE